VARIDSAKSREHFFGEQSKRFGCAEIAATADEQLDAGRVLASKPLQLPALTDEGGLSIPT
jgi:hypothetical protein